MSLVASLTVRWLCVDSLVVGLRSVDASALADVGLLYLEGRQAAAGMDAKRQQEAVAAELRQIGDTEDAVKATIAEMQASAQAAALKHHQIAVSTPEGAEAYRQRVTAYACAAVVSGGILATPLARQVEGLPAVELLPVGAPAPATVEPIAPVRLVDTPRPAPEDEASVIEAMGEANQVPTWALPAEAVEVIGGQAARLAGGRAASLAGFRALVG